MRGGVTCAVGVTGTCAHRSQLIRMVDKAAMNQLISLIFRVFWISGDNFESISKKHSGNVEKLRLYS